MKVLLHSNAPWMPTGYGQQVALFSPRLANRVELAISAFSGLAYGGPLNYDGVEVYGGSGSGYGDDVVEGHALSHFGDLRAGVVLTLIDVQAFEPSAWKELNVASWVPIDHDPVLPAVHRFFDETGAVPIAMSRFGERLLADYDPLYVPHGIDLDVYRPRPKAAARRAGGLPQDAFVVGIIATNQGFPSRKALPQAIEAFAAFLERHDDAYLYIHSQLGSRFEGVDLPTLMRAVGLPDERVSFVDQYRYISQPFPPEVMAEIYSSLDVLLNPAMGEGFGLTVLEAQACGVPAIVTDFSAMSEVCGPGWKVGHQPFWTLQGSWQAMPFTEEIVEALEASYQEDEASRRERAKAARRHAAQYEVDRVIEEHWRPVLAEVGRRFKLS